MPLTSVFEEQGLSVHGSAQGPRCSVDGVRTEKAVHDHTFAAVIPIHGQGGAKPRKTPRVEDQRPTQSSKNELMFSVSRTGG